MKPGRKSGGKRAVSPALEPAVSAPAFELPGISLASLQKFLSQRLEWAAYGALSVAGGMVLGRVSASLGLLVFGVGCLIFLHALGKDQ